MGGGDIRGIAGDSKPSTGGSIVLQTVNSGTKGVSGKLSFTSGTTSSGSSGSFSVSTGMSTNGKGGDMILSIGSGTTYDGGDMYMKSGDSTSNTEDGGSISLVGGYATSSTPAELELIAMKKEAERKEIERQRNLMLR